MGAAKRRGTYEQRRQAAIERDAEARRAAAKHPAPKAGRKTALWLSATLVAGLPVVK